MVRGGEEGEVKEGGEGEKKESGLSEKLDADVFSFASSSAPCFASSKQRHGLLHLRQPPGRRPHELPVRARERAPRGVPAPGVELVQRQHGPSAASARAAAAQPRVARPGQQQLAPFGEGPPEDQGALRARRRVLTAAACTRVQIEPCRLAGGDGVGEEGGARLGREATCFEFF